MSHQWKAFYQWFYLCPHLWEYRSIVSIFMTETMNL